ncbi:sugar transferase [Dellaglioa algida]|uniref:UDP-phosphate galactose phosphotransferase n=1 Tax=Dellaglioa algida TaxID=105612 RepID=A0A5C6M8P5_9LACO|nr:sugar transferase [Dellaglioa algida]MDK1717132.1 sugar transferase [Dellaglioa algida]MDK1719798.1 sugar transferase [Dellaglioa algida]MDK1722074.1 sugar transferase [Dellaglioa algida]MDK1723141.1 sugar transferase [Dellaglioa algida]MDK1739907.1 sugar transferase [Dellaglioa algida]
MYQKYFKRIVDVVLSGIGLILLSWLFLILIIAVKVTSPGPVLFKQKRVGKNRKLFEIYKFRSMRADTPDVPTHLLDNPEKWITPVGKILRKSSLDELPQLLNIFKGDMSIIGPRPALWNQNDLIDDRDKYDVNDVLPGLTGLAQISGRDELPIFIKSKIDGKYVKNITFIGDVKLFFCTLLSVIIADGVSEGTNGNDMDKK